MIDTHAHLSDKRLANDLQHWLQVAWDAGVTRIINVGADLASSKLAVQQANSHSQLYAAVGVHPHDASNWTTASSEELALLAQEPRVCAWGEIGLDYHYDFSPRERQREVFVAQLRLAKAAGLPVIIHDREAHRDVLQILEQEGPYPAGGVMHCYSGSGELVPEYVKLGFYISFAGPLTFRNAKRPVLAAMEVPLERLLVETDCPYLSPEPFRGRLNHPARVVEIVKRLAELRDVDFALMAELTRRNAKRLFSLERGDCAEIN